MAEADTEVAAVQETLDRKDMEVLLAALEAGGLALSHALAPLPSTGAAPGPRAKPYDFRRPQRVGRAQLEAIQALHEAFAGELAGSLSGYLRAAVQVVISRVEPASWGDFVASLPRPAFLTLLRAAGLGLPVALEISAPLAFSMIDRLLGGGDGEPFIPQRPLSQIELRVLEKITNCCAQQLSRAWALPDPLRPKAAEGTIYPQRIHELSAHERVVVLRLEVRVGQRSGAMAVCIPSAVAEALPLFSRLGKGTDARTALERKLDLTRVELRAVLARTTVTLSELLNLRPGDVLTTEKPTNGPLALQLQGQTKFHGSIGLFRGKKAIRITRNRA